MLDQVILNQFLTAALGLVSVLVSIVLAKAWQWINTHVKSKQFEVIRSYIYDLVQWAEQMGYIGELENAGAAKKQAVIDKAQEFASAHGWNIPVSLIETLIESAVLNGIHKSLSVTVGTASTAAVITANSGTTTTVS